MDFLDKYFRDILATVILLICLLCLVFKENKTDSISQTLGYVIIGCLGFMFRGNKK